VSSLRRIKSSKSNGALSKGPSTPAGKLRSSLNAIRHGLCSKTTIVEDDSLDGFSLLLQQHLDRFRPAGDVERAMIEEMSAACWRQRRAWSMETRLIDTQTARHPEGDALDRMVTVFRGLESSHSLSLFNRYETRLHRLYQRSLLTFVVRRSVKAPNDPSPISEHLDRAVKPPSPEPFTASKAPDSKRFRLSQPSASALSRATAASARRRA
jgi:hypothetical protein